jgi:hypothetical protein
MRTSGFPALLSPHVSRGGGCHAREIRVGNELRGNTLEDVLDGLGGEAEEWSKSAGPLQGVHRQQHLGRADAHSLKHVKRWARPDLLAWFARRRRPAVRLRRCGACGAELQAWRRMIRRPARKSRRGGPQSWRDRAPDPFPTTLRALCAWTSDARTWFRSIPR